jgi:hypothetical protein
MSGRRCQWCDGLLSNAATHYETPALARRGTSERVIFCTLVGRHQTLRPGWIFELKEWLRDNVAAIRRLRRVLNGGSP